MKLLAVAMSFGLGAIVSTAFGQYGGGGGFRDGYHSSTLAEGAQRGRADLVRSRGLADLRAAHPPTTCVGILTRERTSECPTLQSVPA